MKVINQKKLLNLRMFLKVESKVKRRKKTKKKRRKKKEKLSNIICIKTGLVFTSKFDPFQFSGPPSAS